MTPQNRPRKPGCLYPECKRESQSRGLCGTHYQTAYNLVKQGRTSWETLVTEGKATASNVGNGVTAWFLGEEPKK